MARVAVVIPFRSTGDPLREIALTWVNWKYKQEFPDWEVRAYDPPGDEWNKPAAVRMGTQACHSEIVVVADADSWCDGVAQAVKAVDNGALWSVPHEMVHRLTREATEEVTSAGVTPSPDLPTYEPPYRGTAGGGILVMRRETALDVPPDIRFKGWGGENGSWRDSLRTLVGMEERPNTNPPLYCLYHEPAPRLDRYMVNMKAAAHPNAELASRYVEARGDKIEMRKLVEGG